jgi:RNA polymerase sigma-70 factor (ECF subfamily)
MYSSQRRNLEAELTTLLAQRDYCGAATSALKGYGSEILSLMAALHRNTEDAKDAFSLFCEALWKGLPGFEGRSSFRTWAYTIAHHASCRFREKQHGNREVVVSVSEFDQMAAALTTTWSRLRKQVGSRVERLRGRLDPDDQMLLILRVERELDWRDLARVMNHGKDLDDPTLMRESARLRKRFQSIKEQLRDMARREAPTSGD